MEESRHFTERFLYKVTSNEIEIDKIVYSDSPIQDDDQQDENEREYFVSDSDIGRLSVTHDPEGNVWLNHVEVSKEFQRQGLAIKMMELAIQKLGLSKIACVKESNVYELSLTQNGENLVAACLRKGLVKPEMCVFSGQTSFILSADSNEISLDPGLNSNVVQNAIVNFHEKADKETLKQSKITQYFPKKVATQEENQEGIWQAAPNRTAKKREASAIAESSEDIKNSEQHPNKRAKIDYNSSNFQTSTKDESSPSSPKYGM